MSGKPYNWKKNTSFFLAGQVITLFGSALAQYAITWYIVLETGSGPMMTISIITGVAPMFFISPFAGVWADRYNRKYLINGSDALTALATLVLALLFLSGRRAIGLLFIFSAVRALGSGIQNPAVSALIPQIVPKDQLDRVNGVMGSAQSVVGLTAPMLSGLLLSFTSIEVIFFVDVITAVLGIMAVFFLVKIPERLAGEPAVVTAPAEPPAGPPAGLPKRSYLRDLREGARYVAGHGFIMRIIVIAVFFNFAVAPVVYLTPLQVARNFGPDLWRLSALKVVFAGGLFLGGLLISLWKGFKNRSYTMALACALLGTSGIMLGLAANFWLYLGFTVAVGMALPLFNVPAISALQARVEGAYIGRVFSVFGMVSGAVQPLGMILFGPLSDRLNINLILIACGLIILGLCFPFLISRALREAGTVS
ncbi:MAG: MFS transporter [Treponema sp.]|jgi:DHA3 family macrolide efflux protein-like MFS transporter|nr:MFS transporter [Treponema sp.]